MQFEVGRCEDLQAEQPNLQCNLFLDHGARSLDEGWQPNVCNIPVAHSVVCARSPAP